MILKIIFIFPTAFMKNLILLNYNMHIFLQAALKVDMVLPTQNPITHQAESEE